MAALAARMAGPLHRRSRVPWVVPLLLVLFGLNHLFYLYVYVPPVPQGIENIRESGTLIVLTRTAPTTRYDGADGPTGFEYEMMNRLGASLNVAVEYRIYETEQELMAALAGRKGQIAAAGLLASLSAGATSRNREKQKISMACMSPPRADHPPPRPLPARSTALRGPPSSLKISLRRNCCRASPMVISIAWRSARVSSRSAIPTTRTSSKPLI